MSKHQRLYLYTATSCGQCQQCRDVRALHLARVQTSTTKKNFKECMKVQDAYLLKHQVNPTPLFSGSPNAGEAERGEAERLGEGCRLGLDGGGPSKRPGSEKRKSDRSSLEKNTKRWSRHDRKSNGNRTFLKCVLLHQKYVDCFI